MKRTLAERVAFLMLSAALAYSHINGIFQCDDFQFFRIIIMRTADCIIKR